MLCPTCGGPDAPRPSGTQTFTIGDLTHRAAECAAISSAGDEPFRTRSGYAAKSGMAPCMDCFVRGESHMYTAGQDPHPDTSDRRRRHDIGEPRRRL